MIDWISHTIVIPLFPLLAALVIAVLKGENIQVYTIFGGTELYMLSVIVLASTKKDIDNSGLEFSTHQTYKRLIKTLIPSLVFGSIIYGIVFMNVRSTNPDISEVSIANLGMAMALATFALCASLQVKLRKLAVDEVTS